MTNIISALRYSRPAVARIVGDQDADDVLQNAAVKALRFAGLYRGDSSYNTWFCRIAINEALYARRKRQLLCVGIDFDGRQGAARDPERLAIEAERNAALYEAILELPTRRREAAVRCLREEPYRDGADKAARHKMREALRRQLCHDAY